MKARLAVVVGLASLATFVVPSHAASGPQVVDIKGDANALNGQGPLDGDLPSNDNATPVDEAALDVVSVTFETQKAGGSVANLVVTLELSDKPETSTPSIYRVTAASDECGTLNWQYSVLADGAPTADFRYCDDSTTLGTASIPVKEFQIFENKLRWTLALSSVKALPIGVKEGKTLTKLGAHTRLYIGTTTTGGATVPQVDVAVSDAVFKIA